MLMQAAFSSSLYTGYAEHNVTVTCAVLSLCDDCLFINRVALTSNRLYSERPLWSARSGWFPIALSSLERCPYIECPYKGKLL